MNLVHREHNGIQKKVRSKIEVKLRSDIRLILPLNQHTSVRCRSYMNINVHCENDAINLGVIKMFDSCGAEKILQLLKKQLADFGITNMQTSAVSIVTDDASVMKKLRKICQLHFQLCYAHGLHLAVYDVLYQNKCVVRTDGEDYDHDENQEEGMFEEDFAALISATA